MMNCVLLAIHNEAADYPSCRSCYLLQRALLCDTGFVFEPTNNVNGYSILARLRQVDIVKFIDIPWI